MKTDDNYKDIAEDLETRLGTSNYELDRLLPKRKNKKVIRCRNHEKTFDKEEKLIVTHWMMVVKIKKQKEQKSVSQKENLNLKIIKTVWKQLNLRIKYII